ncbi:FAD binding domain-containing protein [Aspergillus californicus]
MRFTNLSLATFTLAAASQTPTDPGYNCQLGQPCWPSWQEWKQLNTTLDGNLHYTVPIGAPCYKNSRAYDSLTCDGVESYYNNSIPRGEHYGQTYWLNWESCGNSGCALLGSDPRDTLFNTCSLGRLAAYYVDVRQPTHISAALQFARKNNIRISIKNTGHDFYGRSSVPGSLAIWTKNLDTLDFYPDFTAHNCPSANGQNVGEMGAGVVAGDAYQFFNAHGMDIAGGYEESVGLAGGFGQGGGIGSFVSLHGLLVDNAVEFEVITADGQVRLINECNDPDLFWAMRGGGGGTFAVLTKYRVKVYPSLPIHLYNFSANFTGVTPSTKATQIPALREIIKAHAENQLHWSEHLLAGDIEYYPERIAVGLVLPYADDGSKLKAATASFDAFLRNRTDLTGVQGGYVSYPDYAHFLNYTSADAGNTEPAGIYSILSSRLIPRDVFTNPDTINALADGVVEGIVSARNVLNRTGIQVNIGTPPANKQTSANPAWRTSLWHAIHVGEWATPLSPDALKAVEHGFLDAVEPLKALTPGGGAYVNEASYSEPEWEQTYFGEYYPRLLEVKRKYDPEHLFDCFKCVGWRGEDDSFYSCYNKD